MVVGMNILSKLPIPILGKASYKPNFKVEFQGGGEGLERLVEVAISPERSTIILAEEQLPEPVARLNVHLKSGITSTSGRLAYILEAELVPYAGQKLRLGQGCFAGFEVNKSNYGNVAQYSLHSHLLPKYNSIAVRTGWPGNESGISICNFVAYGTGKRLIQDEARDALTAFAKALEATVNSAYSSAGKNSPEKAVSLHMLRRS